MSYLLQALHYNGQCLDLLQELLKLLNKDSWGNRYVQDIQVLVIKIRVGELHRELWESGRRHRQGLLVLCTQIIEGGKLNTSNTG